IIIGAIVIVSAENTFIAQRQLMLKQTAQQQAAGQATPFQQQQKILLFIFPAMFLIWGFFFPMGLIAYWTTSNLWTMGQQYWVLHRIPHQPVADGKDGKGAKTVTTQGKAKTGTSTTSTSSGNGTKAAAKDAKASTSNGSSKRFRRKKAEPEPEPAPVQRVVRNQRTTKVPRSKRSGSKKGTSSKKS